MQSFDFDIHYRPGAKMAHVDFLSRNLSVPEIHVGLEKKRVLLAEITDHWLLAEQQRDSETSSIILKIQKNELVESVANTYEIRSKILFRNIQRNGKTRCLPVVPRSFRCYVVNHVHEAIVHLGWEKTLDKMYEFYWFENMVKYVRKFVDTPYPR